MKELSRVLTKIPVSAPTMIDMLVKERRAKGEEILSFCVGEPDFATPQEVSAAGIAAIENGCTKYTNPSGTAELRAAAAEAMEREYGLCYAPEQVVITTGGKYAVYAAVMATVNPGDEVILPAPYWPSFRPILELAGAEIVEIPCQVDNGFKLTAAELAAAVTDKTKLLILNNPNNPSGMVYSREELEPIAEVCRKADIYILSDETYGHLIYDGRVFTPMASVSDDAYARTITISGVSKTYSMTGWRIGFAAANPKIIKRMSVFLNHTTGSPCSISQEAALCALRSGGEDTEKMRAAYEERRNVLCEALKEIPLVGYYVPEGAFYVFVDVSEAIARMPGINDDLDFALWLLEEEYTAVVPCTDYGAPGFIRLSYTLDSTDAVDGAKRIARFIGGRLPK